MRFRRQGGGSSIGHTPQLRAKSRSFVASLLGMTWRGWVLHTAGVILPVMTLPRRSFALRFVAAASWRSLDRCMGRWQRSSPVPYHSQPDGSRCTCCDSTSTSPAAPARACGWTRSKLMHDFLRAGESLKERGRARASKFCSRTAAPQPLRDAGRSMAEPREHTTRINGAGAYAKRFRREDRADAGESVRRAAAFEAGDFDRIEEIRSHGVRRIRPKGGEVRRGRTAYVELDAIRAPDWVLRGGALVSWIRGRHASHVPCFIVPAGGEPYSASACRPGPCDASAFPYPPCCRATSSGDATPWASSIQTRDFCCSVECRLHLDYRGVEGGVLHVQRAVRPICRRAPSPSACATCRRIAAYPIPADA